MPEITDEMVRAAALELFDQLGSDDEPPEADEWQAWRDAARSALEAAQTAAPKLAIGEHDGPCGHDRPTHGWQPAACVKPRGHDTHRNGQGDVWRTDDNEWAAMADELDRLRSDLGVIDAWPQWWCRKCGNRYAVNVGDLDDSCSCGQRLQPVTLQLVTREA